MPPQPTTYASRRSLDTISIFALLATLVLAVFMFIPSLAIPFGATKTFLLAAGALITLALYILARLSRGNVVFPPSVLLVALWLPTLAYALSTAFSSVSFNNAFWGSSLEPDTLGFMFVVAVLGTVTALLLRRTEHYHTFLRTAAGAFIAVVVFQILVLIIGQFSPSSVSPSFSIVGSYDDLAFLAGLGVVASLITLRFVKLSELSARVLMLTGIGALVILAVANSSLVWTLLALVSLGLFVESVMRRSIRGSDTDLDAEVVVGVESAPLETGHSSGHSLILPLVVLAASLFFLIGGTLSGAFANALHVNILSVRPSWQSTLSIAQKTYETAPFFGTGPSTFGAEWLKNRDASLNSTVFWNSDFSSGIGVIPTSFVTTGILGAAAWIGLLALLIVLGLRMLIQRAPQDAFIRYVAILSFVASLYLFAVAVFGLPNAVILALAFVFAGVFISTTRFANGSAQWGILFSRSPRLGFLIVFTLTIFLLSSVAAAYALVGHYIAATMITSASTAFAAGKYEEASADAQSSITFAPSAIAYQIQAGVANAQLNQILASSTISVSAAQQLFQTTLSSGINAALTATRLTPSDYRNWIALGNLYAQAVPLKVEGAYASARAAYEKAQALSPTNPQIPFVLAQLDIANKDIKGAQAHLKDAIALKQDYTAAIFLLSQLEVQDGNLKEALASALAAAYFMPNDPNILFQVGILRAASNDLPGAVAALEASVAANPQFANARYFLSAIYAKQKDFTKALTQMQIIAALSSDNAKAVVSQLAALKEKRNPFPANLLSIAPTP